MTEPYQVFIVLRDHVGAPQIRPGDDLPVSVTLTGVVWVVEERADDIVVAAYRCSDGGWTEVWAVARTAIERMVRVITMALEEA